MNAPAIGSVARLTLDGAPLAPAIARAVTELSLRQSLGAPAALELHLAAGPGSDALAPLRPGARLVLDLGAAESVFSGRITEIALSCSVSRVASCVVTARDDMHPLSCRQSMIALRDTSAAELAARLAGDLGLTSHCAETPPAIGLILQQEETDLDLLSDVAAQAGLYPVLRGGRLMLLSLAGDGEEELPLALGRNLLALRATLSADAWLPGVRLVGRDRLTLDPRQAETVLARQDAIEMRDPGRDPPGGPRHLLKRASESDAGAGAEAGASLDRATARLAVAEGMAEGDGRLQPGRVVVLEGVDLDFGGRYVLTRTTHRLSASEGYVTEFSSEPPRRPIRRPAPAASIGKVAGTADPEGMGRCQVQLPDLGIEEGIWMHVVTAGAGPRRGVVALPDVGDEVLVLLPGGDPAHGLVIGGLYGAARRLPQGATDDPRGIVLRSGDGQVLHLHGKDGRLRLASRSGNLLEMRPGQMRLAAAGDLLIEASGRTITIRADAVNFERG